MVDRGSGFGLGIAGGRTMSATGMVGLMALVGLVGTSEPANPTVGFRLQDHRGAWHTLDEARDRKVVVLAFLGVECPLAQAYAPRLAEVAREFEGRGVGFFGVDANQQAMGRSRSAGFAGEARPAIP